MHESSLLKELQRFRFLLEISSSSVDSSTCLCQALANFPKGKIKLLFIHVHQFSHTF